MLPFSKKDNLQSFPGVICNNFFLCWKGQDSMLKCMRQKGSSILEAEWELKFRCRMIHFAPCKDVRENYHFIPHSWSVFSLVMWKLAFDFGCIGCIYLNRNECGYVVPVQAQSAIYQYLWRTHVQENDS